MTTKKSYLALGWLFLLLFTTACVDLKEVNNYSSNSLTGIKKFEDIDYSFKQHCIASCQFEAIRNFQIKRDTIGECNCRDFDTADSVTLLIYNSIRGYFNGLRDLSDNDLTTYQFDAVKRALTAGSFGHITIDSNDVNAYGNISKILLRATTDLYRKKKLTEYIEKANSPLQVLLQKLQFILQTNLKGELNFKKEKLYSYYKEMVLGGSLSDYEKSKATIEYYGQLSEIRQKQKEIDAFAKGLRSIAAGHQELYDNRHKLNEKEIKELIKGYSSNIQDINSEFNKLKK